MPDYEKKCVYLHAISCNLNQASTDKATFALSLPLYMTILKMSIYEKVFLVFNIYNGLFVRFACPDL